MKRQIRTSVWETNSSSVNTLTIMTKEEYKDWDKKWDDPDWVWDSYADTWVNKNESEEYKKYPDSYEFWDNPCESPHGDYFEIETTQYTTEHGDEIVAVSIYGYDG